MAGAGWEACSGWRGAEWLEVQDLLAHHPQGASQPDKDGCLPLHLAASGYAPAVAVRALLSAHPVAAATKDADGCLPLHLAAASCSSEALLELLEAHPAAAAVKDDVLGRLPLHAAAEHRAPVEAVRALLAVHPQGARERDGDGHLPLHLAAESHGPEEVWRVLGQAYPEGVFVKDNDGKAPDWKPPPQKDLGLDVDRMSLGMYHHSSSSSTASRSPGSCSGGPPVPLAPELVARAGGSYPTSRRRAGRRRHVTANGDSTPGQARSVPPTSTPEVTDLDKTLERTSSMMIPKGEVRILPTCLGQGAFGSVHLAEWKGKQVAVKKLLHDSVQELAASASSEEIRAVAKLLMEARIMHRLCHPNVVKVHGAQRDPLSIVMEYVPSGSLFALLHKSDAALNMSLRCLLHMGLDVARGMGYLHSQEPPVVHRDLKSHNILVAQRGTDDFIAKIADFGLAKQTGLSFGHTSGLAGTPMYMPPEVWCGQRMNGQAADVYSFGVLLWELLAGCKPWGDMMWVQVMHQVVNADRRPSDENPGAMRQDTPAAVQALMQACWAKEPAQRPCFGEITTALERAVGAL